MRYRQAHRISWGRILPKLFDVRFATQQGTLDYVWGTSWGVSMRLMGALIMVHGDDAGLVLPPRLAPLQVIIIPIYKGSAEEEQVNSVAEQLLKQLQQAGCTVAYDRRDTHTPGWKFAQYACQGVPLRLSIGPREVAAGTIEVVRRDTQEKTHVAYGCGPP